MGGPGLASPFFFFSAFLLLLLVTLSTPILKTVYLFAIEASVSLGSGLLSASVKDTVKFGIFGWCSTALTAEVLTKSITEPAQCSKRQLGFTVTPELHALLSTINQNDLVDVIQKALSVVLVLHPVVCGLAFLAFFFSIIAILRRHTRFWDLLATIVGVFAAVLTTLVFIIDIVFVSIARSKLHHSTSGDATVAWGNAVWMTLAAAICTWIACVGACWGVVRGRKERSRHY